jgi:hypothetical protein
MGSGTKIASRERRLYGEHYTRKCIMATAKIAAVCTNVVSRTPPQVGFERAHGLLDMTENAML